MSEYELENLCDEKDEEIHRLRAEVKRLNKKGRFEFEQLVPCPKCEGAGYPDGEKLCLCLAEQSQGWTPGQVPYSKVMTILKSREAEVERLKKRVREQADLSKDGYMKLLAKNEKLVRDLQDVDEAIVRQELITTGLEEKLQRSSEEFAQGEPDGPDLITELKEKLTAHEETIRRALDQTEKGFYSFAKHTLRAGLEKT